MRYVRVRLLQVQFLTFLLLFHIRVVPYRSARFTPPPLRSVSSGSSVGSVRSSPSHGGRSPVLATKANSDDELIKFLNSSEPPIISVSEEVSCVVLYCYFILLAYKHFLYPETHTYFGV